MRKALLLLALVTAVTMTSFFVPRAMAQDSITAVHPGYKPIRAGIIIEATERNRQEILNDTSKYILGVNFRKKIYGKCKNDKTEMEILREDELTREKTGKKIKEEMKIPEITPDQIAERVIQLDKFDRWTVIGYCDGLMVNAVPDVGGRVKVYMFGLNAWYDGSRLLSRDIDAK